MSFRAYFFSTVATATATSLLLLAACKAPTLEDQPTGPPTDEATVSAQGAALYNELCSVCHGHQGQGGTGPKLTDWQKGKDTLVQIIDERMPTGRPDKCKGACPEQVASYILSGFKKTTPTCGERSFSPGPRRLRLLSKREYRSTVATLLGWQPPQACPASTFGYAPGMRTLRSVHVAGSFNGWAKTVAAGGWPLTYQADKKLWTLTQQVPAGNHTYKLVLDETDWITDPANPNMQPDGFGGQNSVLNITCNGDAEDVTARLPQDARPEDFPFDNHAGVRVVTSVHVEGFRRTAQALADKSTADIKKLVPCDFAGGSAPACAERFVREFGQRTFRRPLRPEEVTRYKALLLGRKTFELGVKATIAALLQSPHFLYRSELGTASGSGTYRLDPYEVASALSYFLWGGPPDDALLAAAAAGQLGDAASIEKQARRLLQDPRSRDQVAAFTLYWLGADAVTSSAKSPTLFPGFTDSVRQAMTEETRRFAAHVAFDSTGRFDELLTADYSFLNDALAQIYGVTGVTGAQLRKQSYGGSSGRAGLLGHGSVLASYSHSDQTSPIRRGLFVRRRLLCQELPAPPPNAGGVPKVDPAATTRERFRQHTDNPFCNSCHKFIDNVGFGLERFDAIGALRDRENGKAIDASGDLNDREILGSNESAPYSSAAQLGQQLATSERARACFVRQALRFSRGYVEDVAADLCTLTQLQQRFAQSGYRITELLVALTTSPDFLYRK